MKDSGRSSLRALLQAAAESGDSVRIVYNGGRQPGAVRTIRPLRVTETDVRAHDVAEGIAKTFVLERIELTRPGDAAPEYQAPPPPGSEEPEQDLEALLAKHVADLQALGWEVNLSPASVGLTYVYAYFKNGKPRKRTPIALAYYPHNDEAYEGPDESITFTVTLGGTRIERTTAPRPRRPRRPYYLVAPGATAARTFAYGSHAVAVFLSEARRLAPRPGRGSSAPGAAS